ncbi:MAG: gliding motility-associated C-terminal domain-containing protein [Bacteroidales bacterium]|nr:gliding motility-associated C-terminal domain-containing protein [Bacteroidales bacterium]
MQKLLFSILIILSFILINKKGRTQTLTIKNVSVINDQGHVRISWEYSGTDTIVIFRDELEFVNALELIHTITNSSINSYIDETAEANKKPRSYQVKSKTSGYITNSTKIVSTYHLTFNYDSCLQQINLNWNDLEADFTTNEWTPSQFIINMIEDGILQQTPVSASLNEYTVDNILENISYSFSIETQWNDTDSISFSNAINKFTQMPLSPDYINAISASVEGNNTNLKFEIDPNELNKYKLLKSDSYTGIFDTLETITTTETEITLTDYDSEPDSKVNYYKLISVNACGNETTSSDIINNIVLEVEQEEFNNTLTWNSFKEGNLVDYDIYRIVSNSEPELIGSRNFIFFDDNIESLQSYSQFCYFVRGTEEGASESDYSQSNTVCVYLKPRVFIPEAFTPNDDGINDLFQPVFTFIPKDYELRIYNRWGNVIFETGDYTKAWNGKEPNGNPAPAGVYIYYLRIKSPNDQIIEERGNITVIYP